MLVRPRREDSVPSAVSRARDAYIAGRPIESCPYPLGSCEAMLWISEFTREEQEDEEAIYAEVHQRGRLGK